MTCKLRLNGETLKGDGITGGGSLHPKDNGSYGGLRVEEDAEIKWKVTSLVHDRAACCGWGQESDVGWTTAVTDS